jgi:hypothetical protein
VILLEEATGEMRLDAELSGTGKGIWYIGGVMRESRLTVGGGNSV